MFSRKILPEQPQEDKVQPPLVYVDQDVGWEYHHEARNLEEKGVLEEEALNALGSDGWELVTVLNLGNWLHYYFKRPV
jgi:hypothetical protein